MLHYLISGYTSKYHLANLLHYLTLRGGLAAFIALTTSIIFGGRIIEYLKKTQVCTQPIRDDGPQTHHVKAGTPSMGGVIILASSTFACFICCDLVNPFVIISLFVFLSLGLLGFVDDYQKGIHKNSKGIRPKYKFVVQIIIGCIVYFAASYLISKEHSIIYFPFFKNLYIDIGILFLPFVIFMISGSSNAVNLTDGLDGLAIVPFGMATSYFGAVAYLMGVKHYAEYLHILHVPGISELFIVCSSLIGSSIGFLWFNCKPAEVFMGDTGSLALGGFLGVVSILTKQEAMLAIVGGVFLVETLSVIIQVSYFKMTKGKRIFKMSPLHHHYEKLGMSETKIVIRFWIISLLLLIVAFIALKVR